MLLGNSVSDQVRSGSLVKILDSCLKHVPMDMELWYEIHWKIRVGGSVNLTSDCVWGLAKHELGSDQ